MNETKIAVYAGSFDPITLGHISVIEKVISIFDQINVVVAENPNKKCLFSKKYRVQLIKESLNERGISAHIGKSPCVKVVITSFDGLIVHYAKSVGANCLIRGVRSIFDVNEELQMSGLNRQISPNIFTLFVPADLELSLVSSSALKALWKAGAPISKFCTKAVMESLENKYFEDNLTESVMEYT